MKLYSAYFEYPYSLSPRNQRDFAWWDVVVPRILERCDSFQLECRKGDDAGQRSCARMGAEDRASLTVERRSEIWTGAINASFRRELLEDAFDVRGMVKWASVLLREKNRIILALTRNGREIGLHGMSEEELEFLASAFHGNHFSFYYWEDAGNGQLTHFQPIYGGESEISVLIEAYQKGKDPKIR